ncbi:holin [Bifidobacterium sp. B4001]|uniref:phage holin n=1 Tax=unclassified Bifidobacterium TaxID=2608897 RepID=UPI00226BB841|nr:MULTISPECIES: phage holin [unclassified Bifidobacterium]MCX8673015.1 holin [Bifidobacterium sp. B4079]MCX8681448.1 holin [Bifidobacterium sp. B4001]
MPDTTQEDQDHGYLLPDKVYHALKWAALVLLPALAVFVNTVGPTLGLPHVDAIVTTLNALGLLIAACIGVSQAKTTTSK